MIARKSYRVLYLCLLCMLLFPGIAHTLESQLHEVLLHSSLGREAEISYRMEDLDAGMQRQSVFPVLYLAAPAAYRIALPPEGRHAGQAQLGVRGQLPYGLSADLSWNHSLEYLHDVEDPAGEPQNGFLQTLAAQLDIQVPLYFSPKPYISSSIAAGMNEQAGLRLEIARNQLLQAYLQDWFDLYRRAQSLTLLSLHIQAARERVEAYELLVSSGDAALHELWQAERNLNARELEHLQADIERERLRSRFFSRYGVQFPEQALMPTGNIQWQHYAVQPLLSSELQLVQLQAEAAWLEYRNERSSSAPRINLSLNLNGPTPTEAGPFGESIRNNFTDRNDWNPGLSLGLSLSTDDFRTATVRSKRHELSMQGLNLQQQRRIDELHAQIQQSERLHEQYLRIYEREQQALTHMQSYVDDMHRRHDSGEIDLLQLNEILLQHAEMQGSAQQTLSRLREVELHLQLLSGRGSAGNSGYEAVSRFW
ncbi:TolC family protein [Spirochaeta dissipatitropha]